MVEVSTLVSPGEQWSKTTSDWVIPGRFSFFCFKVAVGYECYEWFPGLDLQPHENGYYVGGTVDKFSSACYTLLNTDSPHDCCKIYRTIYQAITSRGFEMRGERTSQAKKFYLK